MFDKACLLSYMVIPVVSCGPPSEGLLLFLLLLPDLVFVHDTVVLWFSFDFISLFTSTSEFSFFLSFIPVSHFEHLETHPEK